MNQPTGMFVGIMFSVVACGKVSGQDPVSTRDAATSTVEAGTPGALSCLGPNADLTLCAACVDPPSIDGLSDAGLCAGGRCPITLLANLNGGSALAAGGGTVYCATGPQRIFVDFHQGMTPGLLISVPAAGGTTDDLGYAGYALDVTHLAVNSTQVFWTDGDGINAVVATDSGAALPAIVPDNTVTSFAVDDSTVYWASNAVKKRSLAGNPSEIVWSEFGTVETLALNATHPYWVAQRKHKPDAVLRAPVEGGSPEQVATLESAGAALALDDARLYVVDTTACASPVSTILGAPLGGGPTTPVASVIGAINDLIVARKQLYWVTGESLFTVAVSGGTPKVLVARPDLGQIAADDTNLYFMTPSTVWKLPLL